MNALPVDIAPVRRTRTRRGGPRTPLPLVGLMAVCAGIGIAYVGQIAHATQATYQASDLQAQQATLKAEAARLDDQLDQLRATERIVAAAQQMGMRPAGKWAYVATVPISVVEKPGPQLAAAPLPADPVQKLIAELGGAFGLHPAAP